jgi:Kef-type K+ transport system membrane component KefB
MSLSETYLLALLLIFSAPWLVWRFCTLDDYAPLVVVQIIGGIVLGPGVLGAAYPAYYHFIFTEDVVKMLNGVAQWAVILFVFAAGIELDVRRAFSNFKDTATTAILALLTPLALGSLATLALLQSPGWVGSAGTSWQVVAGIGMACAVTALPILVLFLEKLKLLHQPFGQRILGYASFDDIAIWGVLALILLDWQRVGRQLGYLLAFPLAAFLLRALMPKLKPADRMPIALLWLLICSLAADWAGLHYMVGAFMAGAVVEAAWFNREDVEQFRRIVLLTIMPIFFLSTGLRTTWNMGGVAVFGAALLLLAAAVGGKLLGVGLAGRILKWQKGEAWSIGWLLQTKALIMIIFVNILLDKRIITSSAFTALLLMAIMSTMLSIPMVKLRL